MTENIETIRPHAVAVGGIFSAALNALKHPLMGILLLPLAIVFPNLASNLYYIEFSKQNIVEKKNFREIFSAKIFLCTQCVYFIILYILYNFVSYKAEQYLESYKEKALNNQVLQIATPEQIEYARSMSVLFGISAIVIFCLVVLMATYSSIKAIKQDNIHNNLLCVKMTLAAFAKNLHLYILIFVLFYVLAMIIENSFAHYKLMYLESVILKKEGAFDPVFIYLFIRIYIMYILLYVLNLLSLRSVNSKDTLK
jgi:hypothetical protein